MPPGRTAPTRYVAKSCTTTRPSAYQAAEGLVTWQASGPEYIAVISDLPGEVRFAATASQRLAQLGAITQGMSNPLHHYV